MELMFKSKKNLEGENKMGGSLIGTISILSEEELEALKKRELKKGHEGDPCEYIPNCPALEYRTGVAKGRPKLSCQFPGCIGCDFWQELKSEEVYHSWP